MHPPLSGLVVDQFGFLTGIVLYVMLLVMVWRERSAEGAPLFSRRGRLPLLTGVFGLIWNVGGLVSFGVRLATPKLPGPDILAVAFSALGFLPAVVVHALVEGRETRASSRLIHTTIALAYGLSITAGVIQIVAAFRGRVVPAPAALWLLTIGFTLLAALLFVMTRQQPVGRRGVWVVAFSIFAVSALHFNRHVGNEAWWVELVGHHASLPLALAILHQDYRFAFADLFLKNAIAILLLVGTALGLLSAVALPLLRLRDAGGQPDPRAVALVIVLWIGTVIAYTYLRRLASRVVDRIVLQRPDYHRALEDFSRDIQRVETEREAVERAADFVRLIVSPSDIQVVTDPLPSDRGRLAMIGPDIRGVTSDAAVALLRLRTVDAPHWALVLGPLTAGRRLLSDDLHWLEAIARLASRRIDGLRVSQERHAHSLREAAMERLAAEAELRALRAQLNPHFLFNALTTIGYLIRHQPSRAFDTLLQLTSVLRGVLRRTSREFSTLGDEIDFISSYLDIERARFEERLDVAIEVAPAVRDCPLPTLLLQPLVENAVKHGIGPRAQGGAITIRARARDGMLSVTIEDSGLGFSTDAATDGPGVGLHSVEDRLRAHYGNGASLRVQSAVGAGTIVDLLLPLGPAHSHPVADLTASR